MNGSENLFQAETMLHRQHKLSEQIAPVLTDYGNPKDFIFARLGKNLNKTTVSAIGNGPVELTYIKAGYFIVDTLFSCFLLIQADSCHLRVDKGRPGDD